MCETESRQLSADRSGPQSTVPVQSTHCVQVASQQPQFIFALHTLSQETNKNANAAHAANEGRVMCHFCLSAVYRCFPRSNKQIGTVKTTI